jgi:hypothetical protein
MSAGLVNGRTANSPPELPKMAIEKIAPKNGESNGVSGKVEGDITKENERTKMSFLLN